MKIPQIFKSRKFIYGAIGVSLASFYFFASLALVILFPASQASVVSLFSTALVFLAGIVAPLIGTHFWMDKISTHSSLNVTNLTATGLNKLHALSYDSQGVPYDYSPEGDKDEWTQGA